MDNNDVDAQGRVLAWAGYADSVDKLSFLKSFCMTLNSLEVHHLKLILGHRLKSKTTKRKWVGPAWESRKAERLDETPGPSSDESRPKFESRPPDEPSEVLERSGSQRAIDFTQNFVRTAREILCEINGMLTSPSLQNLYRYNSKGGIILLKKILTMEKLNSQESPSMCTSDYWIWARNISNKNNLQPGLNCGKWMIFRSTGNIDEAWSLVKTATENGELGFGSKVSTVKEKPQENTYMDGHKVICVYTYDWTNELDVMRVRDSLRNLGFTEKLPYKSDADTLAGKYRATGHKKISKYYC